MIDLIIQVVVYKVLLLVLLVPVRVEVRRLVFYLVSLTFLSRSSLFNLKTVFFFSSQDHVAIFEGALVGTAARVRWGHSFLEPWWEVVQLETKMTHTVHISRLLRVRIFCEEALCRTLIQLAIWCILIWHKLCDENLAGPVAVNFVDHPLFLPFAWLDLVQFTFALVFFATYPALLRETNLTS